MSEIIKRRNGIVAIVDALGASAYSENKIKTFLSARNEINSILKNQASLFKKHLNIPNTYTFGDTLIVVQEFKNKEIPSQIMAFVFLMQNYLYHSMEKEFCSEVLFQLAPTLNIIQVTQ